MCGIITFISTNKDTHSGKEVINQYQDQFSRGTEGFGLIEVKKNGIKIERATEPVKALMDLRETDAPIVIFHHRHPTSTDNTMKQTHPILVANKELTYNWLVIHNGVIRNDTELFTKHTEELGYEYTTKQLKTQYIGYNYSNYSKETFNDSESLAIELARYFEGHQTQLNIKGSAAFVALKVAKKTGKPIEMYFGRSESSPLETKETPSGLLIASDIEEPTGLSPELSYQIIDLQGYFTGKTLPKDISNSELISTTFDLEVLKIKEEKVATKSASKTIISTKGDETSEEDFEENYEEEEYDPFAIYQNERESSFLTMADRAMDDIQPEIEDFFTTLNYTNPGEELAEEIGNNLTKILKAKIESTEKTVRPYWDRKQARLFEEYSYPTEDEEDEEITEEKIKEFNKAI